MDWNSTDDPWPVAEPGQLWPWFVAATAIVAVLSVALVGLQSFAFLGLVQVPAVLAFLLTVRAIVGLAQGRSTTLRNGRQTILSGISALVVPVALLGCWMVLRETGTIGARLMRSTSQVDTNSSWPTWRSDGGAASEPAAPPETDATGIELVLPTGVLQDRIGHHLRDLATAVAGAQVRGRIRIEFDPPWALLPLWKSATRSCSVVVALDAERPGTGVRGRLQGELELRGQWTMLGFAAQRDFHTYLGDTMGREIRKALAGKLRDLLAPGK